MSGDVDIGSELLTHLRGQGFRSAAALLELARDTAHEGYLRAVCNVVSTEVYDAAQVSRRLAETFARPLRPRLRRDALRRFWTLLALSHLVHAFEHGDQARARDALARIGAA